MTDKIADLGHYAQILSACLENTQELKAPEDFDQYFKKKRAAFQEKPAFRLPPNMQALYVERSRLVKMHQQFPITGTVADKTTIQRRLNALNVITQMLAWEMIPFDQLPMGQFSYVVDGNWNFYLAKKSES